MRRLQHERRLCDQGDLRRAPPAGRIPRSWLKHLPLLETYTGEGVKSNVLGTQTVLEAKTDRARQHRRLRSGEKLHEDLFGEGEHDDRPLHPLISHVAVPALRPDDARALDAYADPAQVIEQLTALCGSGALPNENAQDPEMSVRISLPAKTVDRVDGFAEFVA